MKLLLSISCLLLLAAVPHTKAEKIEACRVARENCLARADKLKKEAYISAEKECRRACVVCMNAALK